MRAAPIAFGCISIFTILACGSAESRAGAPLVSRDTIGDTIVVRTESGSLWGAPRELVPAVSIGVLEGEDAYMFGPIGALAVSPDGRIFVLDLQVPVVRLFSPDGVHMRDVGSAGEGPGEYKEPDGGLAYMPNDQVIVRDPGTGKMVVFDGAGEPADDWRLPYGGGFNTSRGFYWDSAGHLMTLTITNLGAPVTEWQRGFIRFDPQGTVLDTLIPPAWNFDPWIVSGRRENSSSTSRVPYGPESLVYYSPLGYWVGGLNTDYRIDQFRPDGSVVRIERSWDPVAVDPTEASLLRRRMEKNFRDRFPGWSWNGPDIPDTKPPYSSLMVGEDGRIWVVVATPSEEFMTVADARDEERATGNIVNRFRALVAFDVFEPDGEYLGRANAPQGFSLSPRPVFRGETVWAVVQDEFEVQRVVRLEVTPNH